MSVRVGVVQAGSVPYDQAATLENMRAWAARAAAQGCRLVLFPEAYLGGYPKGADFGVTVGRRTPEGRKMFARYAAGALSDPAPLAQTAAEFGVWLVAGAVEQGGGTLYCSVFFASPQGRIAGKRRKVMPTAMERVIWGFGDGSTLGCVDTPFGVLGAAICWENYMPQLRLALYSQGVQFYCAPSVDDRETWLPAMRHIAVEGRCFVLSAVQWQEAGEWDAIGGGSVIVDPFGQLLAGPLRGGEGLLTADLDPELIVQGKFDLDVAGHYARPDIFRLSIDRSPRTPCPGVESSNG